VLHRELQRPRADFLPLFAAPPKALDEEEVEYLDRIAAKEKAQQKRIAEQEELELTAFGTTKTHLTPG
jgi:hypothetical protein